MSKVIPNSVAVARVAISASLDQVKTLVDVMSKIASKNSPHDTGNNSDSVAKDAGMEGGKIVGRVYTQSGYGGWLEIGTSRMAARPYIAPAYQEAKDLTR